MSIDKELKLDYRIVIGFQELSRKPISLLTGKLFNQIDAGMRALVRERFDNGKLLLNYNRTLFTFSIIRNTISRKDGKYVSYSIGLWSPVKNINLGSWGFSWKLGSNWIDKPVPEEIITQMEKVMYAYKRHLQIDCHLCNKPTLITEIKFYPFAGGACPQCAEEGRIPKVDTT